jgi:mRNA interferase MazF
MIQGDVCLYTFKEPDKRRPVLILTRNAAIPNLNSVTVAQITTTIRNLDSFVWLDQSDGMQTECAVNLDTIQTVQKDKLGKVIAHLSMERLSEVREAIKFVFDFKNL